MMDTAWTGLGISGESYYDANHDDVDDDYDGPDEDDMILTDQKWKLLVIFTPMMTAEMKPFKLWHIGPLGIFVPL